MDDEYHMVLETREAHDRLLRPDILQFLNGHKMGKDKKGATYHDGIYLGPRFYSMYSDKSNFIQLREMIIESVMKGAYCGSLNDRARKSLVCSWILMSINIRMILKLLTRI